MKKFILHGDMASHFCESITLNVSTMREAISALCSNFPGFQKYYIDKVLSGVSYVFVDSKKNEHEQYCLDLPLLDDEYHIVPCVSGSAGGENAALGFGTNLITGYLMSLFTDLLGDGLSDDGTPEYEIITTNSFIYSQNENTVEQGSPVPVVYGQLRVGSKVIQSSVQNYDYNYDAASIYPTKPRGNNFNRILHLNSTDYSHSDPVDLKDLRNGTPEAFLRLSDSDITKRVGHSGLAFAKNNHKEVSQKQENEPINQFYGGGGKNNERHNIGPSITSSPVKSKPIAVSTWWDHGSPQTVRPFLFPPVGQIDYDMRPQSEKDFCVERPIINGSPVSSDQDRCDAWRSKTRGLMVGVRGSYHKLESIGINKSLEILSEGPIVGFVSPINSFERDNGKANWPYGSESIGYSAGGILVEDLKYDAVQDVLVSTNNTKQIPIIDGGENYTDITNQLVQANGDGVNGFRIFIDTPSSESELNAGGITFSDPDDLDGLTNGSNNSNNADDVHFVSANNLFLLSQDDGELKPNTNSLTEINRSLNSIYLVNENTEEDGEKPVFQFNLLERDKESMNTDFSIGNGMGLEGFELEMEPDSEDFQYSVDITQNSGFDRRSESKCLDLTRYQDVFDSNFNALINTEFVSNTSSNVPHTNLGWDKMARIYYEGGSELKNNLNESVTITLATASWTVRTSYSFDTGETFTSHSGTAQVTISLRDYVSLNNVTIISSITGIPSTCQHSSSTNCRRSFNWNSGYTAFKNSTYTYNVSSKTVNITELIRADSSFANNLFNALNAKAGNALKYVDFNSRRYLKFGVGSGSSIAPGGRIGGLPTYIIDSNNKQNFDSVEILSDGAILDDDSDHPKGFYCPFIFPRVTVFIIRESTYESGNSTRTIKDIYSTSIDAVASVTSRGTIEKLHLLNTPNLPVWDSNLKMWTPIMPHLDKYIPHANITSNNQTMLKCKDYGLICKIDTSNNSDNFKYDVDKGQLKSRLDSTSVHSSWSNYIRYNNLSPNSNDSAQGLFSEQVDITKYNDPNINLSKLHLLDDLGNEWSTPDRYAQLSLGLEKLNLNSSYKKSSIFNSIFDTHVSCIYTGRISSVSMSDRGVGYQLKNGNGNGEVVTFTIYNQTYGVKSININDGGLGYKPHSEFFVYGFSNSKVDSSNNGHAYISFKGKCKVDRYGSAESIEILDKGFGFSSLGLSEDFIFCTEDLSSDAEISAIAKGILPNVNPTNNIKNTINFTKRPLIIKSDDAHFSMPGIEGRMGKFFVKQTGLGFNFNQAIETLFSEMPSFIPPTFKVTISNGSLSLMSIEDQGFGYSASDQFIKLSFSSPDVNNFTEEEDIDEDPEAVFSSIFLNDVPIRDKKKRFNFSKFHFDMRVGHYKNGNLDRSIPDSLLASDARSPLMNNEFKLPSHTKMVDYPLYGPRNHGEKDYYYTHTVKNPEVTSVTLSLRINQLHYVYEGDESAMYINLIPLVAAGLGIMLGKMLAEGIAGALVQDPVSTFMSPKGTIVSGQAVPCTGQITTGIVTLDSKGFSEGSTVAKTGELAKQAIMTNFLGSLFGIVGGLIASYIIKYFIKCSQVPFLCFKVGELIKNSGEIWPAKIALAIEHGVEGSDLKSDTVIIRGCATNPYVKDIVIDIDPPEGDSNNFKNRILKIYRLTRAMDPVTGGLVESRYSIDASVHSVTEHVEGFFSYPNTALIGTRVNSKDFPSIPKKEYLIKGRIINIPINYNEVNGTYNGTWDGSFIQQWTSNPAWVIYDLLINERYGCGKYGIKESDIDKWSFYTFAQFCDERIETTIDGVLDNGSPYMERRHMCNLYIDSEKEAYEYIKDLLKIYNSTINFSGGQIYITKDSSISDSGATMIFNHTNVTEEGFSYSTTPSTKRITAASVDYLDERDNYMLKTEYVEDQQGISEHGYSHAKMAGIGITRRGEAHRLCWNKILTRQLEKEVIHFKAGLQSAYLKIGDVINVLDNNKISRHSGGRIKKVLGKKNRNTTSIYDVEIDIPIEALSGIQSLLVEVSPNSSMDSNYLSFDIVESSGFQLGLSIAQNSTYSINPGATWMIESNDSANISPKPFRVKQIKEVKNMEFEITAVEYIEEKYSQVDSSTSNLNGSYDQSREYSGHEIIV